MKSKALLVAELNDGLENIRTHLKSCFSFEKGNKESDFCDNRSKIKPAQRMKNSFEMGSSKLVKDFENHREKLEQVSTSFYDRAAIGYYLHSFYNGTETIFESIARFFENDVGRESWHSNLLKRMKLEVEGVRPAVLDDELYRLLNQYRGFRHVFRHSYSFDLDWEREKVLAVQLSETARQLNRQVRDFVKKLDALQ